MLINDISTVIAIFRMLVNEIATVTFLFQMLLNKFSACIALFQKHIIVMSLRRVLVLLICGWAISDISHHFPVYAVIPSVRHFKNNAHQIGKRDMKNFKEEHLSKT